MRFSILISIMSEVKNGRVTRMNIDIIYVDNRGWLPAINGGRVVVDESR